MKIKMFVTSLLLAGFLSAGNWPAWRGEGGNGAVTGEPPPLELAEKLLWKTELPGRGCSTPIVWGEKLFVSSPVGDKDGLLAYDLKGKEIWRKTFGAGTPGRSKRASSSNSSPITDGNVVVAYFKSGNVACLDLDGKPLWELNLQEKYGKDGLWWDQGTSPLFAGGNVVVAVMQTAGESYLVSLDPKTGKEIWKTARKYETGEESGDSYTTPHMVKLDGKEQIICWGADHLTGHDAATGKLLWQCGGFNPKRAGMQRVIASAVIGDGFAVVPFNRGESIASIRLGGSGDLPEDSWAWRNDGIGSDAASPILHDGKFYVLKDGGPERGRLTCLDVKTGKQLWESSLPKAPQVYYSSPLLVEDQIYCVREDGMVFSGKITKEGLSDIHSHALEEVVVASPISVAGRLIIRSENSIFCFGEK